MSVRRLTVASHNAGKLGEISELLAGLPVEVRSLRDFPTFTLPAESGASFAENAELKARAAAPATGGWALADDSGLVVPALGGAPGVRSARVAASDPERILWLLGQMAEVTEGRREAEFVCALALADEQGRVLGRWEGRAPGRILQEPRGAYGFGYDPVFLYESAGKTFAEMSSTEKSAVSHRGQALREFRKWMEGPSGGTAGAPLGGEDGAPLPRAAGESAERSCEDD